MKKLLCIVCALALAALSGCALAKADSVDPGAEILVGAFVTAESLSKPWNNTAIELTRTEKGWEFPNVEGKLTTQAALAAASALGLHPREIRRQVERKHIFTHIQWQMTGIYLESAQTDLNFVWMTPEEIDRDAALPTAFRQFWEERESEI